MYMLILSYLTFEAGARLVVDGYMSTGLYENLIIVLDMYISFIYLFV